MFTFYHSDFLSYLLIKKIRCNLKSTIIFILNIIFCIIILQWNLYQRKKYFSVRGFKCLNLLQNKVFILFFSVSFIYSGYYHQLSSYFASLPISSICQQIEISLNLGLLDICLPYAFVYFSPKHSNWMALIYSLYQALFLSIIVVKTNSLNPIFAMKILDFNFISEGCWVFSLIKHHF